MNEQILKLQIEIEKLRTDANVEIGKRMGKIELLEELEKEKNENVKLPLDEKKN